MVAAGTTVPSPISPLMRDTPQNTYEWVCAWVDNINLNSPEKSDGEIKDFLKDKGYTSKRSLKYGILADPARLQSEWGISEVLAEHLSEEALTIANASGVVATPAFQQPAGLNPIQLQLLQDAVTAAVSATSNTPAPAPSVKPDKAWIPFTHKFPPQPKGELRIPKSSLADLVGLKLLYHAQSQSTTAGQHLMEYLKDPASFHDEAARQAFEAKVSKHE